MSQEQPRTQNQEAAAVASDPTLNKEAVDEVVEVYEEASPDEKDLDSATEKELGKVEQALEDLTLGIEDAS